MIDENDNQCAECDDFDSSKCCFCTWRQEQDAAYMRETYIDRTTNNDAKEKTRRFTEG